MLLMLLVVAIIAGCTSKAPPQPEAQTTPNLVEDTDATIAEVNALDELADPATDQELDSLEDVLAEIR